MKKFPWFTVCLYTTLGACFGALIFGLIRALAGDKSVGNADVAAWVQALSSVAALVAAIGIADHQARIQRRLQREQALTTARKMSRLAVTAVRRAAPEIEDYLRRVLAWPEGAGGFVYDSFQINESKALLDMAVAKVDHPEIIQPLIAVHAIAGSVLKSCSTQQGVIHPAGHSRVRLLVSQWSDSLQQQIILINAVAEGDEKRLEKFIHGGR